MTTAPIQSITDEQIAEIEAIAENGCSIPEYLADDVVAIISRLRAAERDAERYRWLRDNWFQVYGTSLGERGIKLEIGDIWNRCGKPDHVDAAIDTAMKGELE